MNKIHISLTIDTCQKRFQLPNINLPIRKKIGMLKIKRMTLILVFVIIKVVIDSAIASIISFIR